MVRDAKGSIWIRGRDDDLCCCLAQLPPPAPNTNPLTLQAGTSLEDWRKLILPSWFFVFLPFCSIYFWKFWPLWAIWGAFVWAAAIPQIFLRIGIGTWSLEDSRYISAYVAAVKWTRVKPEYFRVIAACLRISHRWGKSILPCTASLEATSHGKEPSPHLKDELMWIVSDMWFTCGQSKFGTGINRNMVDVYDHEIQACVWDAHIW